MIWLDEGMGPGFCGPIASCQNRLDIFTLIVETTIPVNRLRWLVSFHSCSSHFWGHLHPKGGL